MDHDDSEIAATVGGMVAVAASATAGLTIWLLVTAPTTVARALGEHEVAPLVQVALEALYGGGRGPGSAPLTEPVHDTRTKSPRRINTEGVVIGLVIVALGVALLLDRAGVIHHVRPIIFWPFVLITVGLVKLANRRDDGTREGGWWVFLGVWLLLNDIGVLRFGTRGRSSSWRSGSASSGTP